MEIPESEKTKRPSWIQRLDHFASAQYGSRKFVFVVAVFLVSTVALYFKVATFDAWAGVIKWVGGTFLAGHAVTDVATSISNGIAASVTGSLEVPRRT